jgi:hypothetical protein
MFVVVASGGIRWFTGDVTQAEECSRPCRRPGRFAFGLFLFECLAVLERIVPNALHIREGILPFIGGGVLARSDTRPWAEPRAPSWSGPDGYDASYAALARDLD